MNNLHPRFIINYEFKQWSKGSSVAIELLADLDYIDQRFKELKECYPLLLKRISEINIASRKGAAEFDMANSMVGYYALSAIHLNSHRELLISKTLPPRELSKAELEVKERGRLRWEKEMYTGKLSQGKK